MISYDLINMRQGYAPLHLQYERSLNGYISMQMSVNRFRVKPVQVIPQNTSRTISDSRFSTGDVFTDIFIALLGSTLDGDEPAYGTMKAHFNQRGTMIGFGPKFYLNAPTRSWRPYVQTDVQWYSYRYDQYQFTRSKNSLGIDSYQLTTTESITTGHRTNTVAGRFDGGLQVKLSKCMTAEMGFSLGYSAANARAKKAKSDFGTNRRLDTVEEVPIRAAVVGPLRMSVGYRF
jgi:hypothetical protein